MAADVSHGKGAPEHTESGRVDLRNHSWIDKGRARLDQGLDGLILDSDVVWRIEVYQVLLLQLGQGGGIRGKMKWSENRGKLSLGLKK